jgi:hypothetical protein
MRDASSFDDAATLLGGNGSDVLVGRSGLLTGPPGLSDTLQGGSGSDSYYLVGRAEVSGDVLYDNSKGLPVIENIEDFTETIQIYSGTSYTGDYFGGFFELVQISGGYDGTNSGYGTPGVAVVVVDTTPGGYLYLDTDVTQPGYSVLARVLNGAENLTTGNVSIVDGTMTPPPRRSRRETRRSTAPGTAVNGPRCRLERQCAQRPTRRAAPDPAAGAALGARAARADLLHQRAGARGARLHAAGL